MKIIGVLQVIRQGLLAGARTPNQAKSQIQIIFEFGEFDFGLRGFLIEDEFDDFCQVRILVVFKIFFKFSMR